MKFRHCDHPNNLVSQDVPRNVSWYLICLFIVDVLFFTMKKDLSKVLTARITFIAFPVAGYLLTLVGDRLPFEFDIAVIGTVFYGVGYSIRQTNEVE